jgi:hypothetical protein
MSPETESAGHHHGAFASAVLDPAKPVPPGIGRANGGDPQEAFNVYRNNVVASLADALKAAFPITSHLLGEGLQRALMADFARAHPPKNAVLSTYGGAFPGYVAQHEATRARPFLADIALLERRRLEAYHAADAPLLDGATLGEIDPDALSAGTLMVHPAIRLVSSRFPIATIYAIERAELNGDRPAAARTGVDMRRGEAVLITRPVYDVAVQTIGPGDFAFIKACAHGLPFGAAADSGFQADPGFDLQVSLGLCLSTGVFTAFQSTPHF